MKKYVLLGLLLLTGCYERYIYVARNVLPKTVMIENVTMRYQYVMSFEESGIKMDRVLSPVKYLGAGVLISKEGHILTCAHLFESTFSSTLTVITSNGTRLPTIVINKDEEKDLALLKIEGEYVPARLAKYPPVVAQEVMLVGNPKGLDFSVSHGIVSYLGRNLDEKYAFTQVDAPLNSGNSGGPLFNLSGELIGINARRIPDTDGLGFAISPETIREFLSVFKGLEAL